MSVINVIMYIHHVVYGVYTCAGDADGDTIPDRLTGRQGSARPAHHGNPTVTLSRSSLSISSPPPPPPPPSHPSLQEAVRCTLNTLDLLGLYTVLTRFLGRGEMKILATVVGECDITWPYSLITLR